MPVLQRKSKDEIPSESINRLCPSCFTRKGAGIQHKCGKEVTGNNLLFLALALGSLQAVKVAARILRNKMETEGLADGSKFYISTGGNPLHVKVGTPEYKAAKRTVNQISVQIIKQLQIVLELSLNRTKQMMAVFTKRNGYGHCNRIKYIWKTKTDGRHYFRILSCSAYKKKIIILKKKILRECFLCHMSYLCHMSHLSKFIHIN